MPLQSVIFLLIVILTVNTDSYNILAVFPHSGRSQFETFAVLLRELSKKGHNLTVISHFPLKHAVPNYKDIGLKSTISHDINLTTLHVGRTMKYFLPLLLGSYGSYDCEQVYSSEAVQNFLIENKHLDLAIISHFNTNCFLTLAKKYNIPVVRVLACGLLPWTDDRYANPNNPSFIPNNFLEYSDKMSFFERLENSLLVLFHNVYFNNLLAKKDKEISTKYFGELGASLFDDMLNDSILLVNTHFSVNYPRPLVPNIIEVGGIHIGQPNVIHKVK